MARQHTSFVLGYHGCDKDVGERVLVGEDNLKLSERDYDWLGSGIYFWEGDPRRAREWAEDRVRRGQATCPFVVGTVIDLRNCLDLTHRPNLDLLADTYKSFAKSIRRVGQKLPKNVDARGISRGETLRRKLDCAVINHLHADLAAPGGTGFDTDRGLFVEGPPVYLQARFYRQTHTQIAVRTRACIIAVFRP